MSEESPLLEELRKWMWYFICAGIDQLPVFSYGRDGWSSTTYSKGFNGPIVRIPPSRWDDCNAFDKVSTDGTHFRGIKVDAKIYGNFEGWEHNDPCMNWHLVWLEMLWRPSSIMNIISTMNCMIRTIMIRVIIFQMFVKMLISIMCFSKWQLYMIMRNHARLSVFGICLC